MAVPGRHRAETPAFSAEVQADVAVLADAVEAIGSDLELAGVLRRTVEVARALVDAERGVLVTVDEAGAVTDLVAQGRGVHELADVVGQSPARPAADGVLGAPVRSGAQIFGHLYVGGSHAGSFTETDEAYVVAVARAAGTLIRHAATFEEGERRRAWLDATVQVAEALSSTDDADGPEDLARAMDRTVREVSRVTGAQAVALVQFDGVEWEVGARTGSDAALEERVGALAERFQEAAATGQPVRVAGEPTDLIVPLHTELADRGVLLLRLADGPIPTRGLEADLLQAFAGQVSLALDRSHALGERHELLLAADRDRIGRDLHDLVIQRLYATGLQLQAARAGEDPERMAAGLAAGVRELDLSIRDLRATIFELGRGIGQKLRDEVRALNTEYATVLGFLPTLRTSGPVDSVLSGTAHDQLLLTLREALSNVARHARATEVQVELTASADWFMLRVTDNGVGIGEDAGPGSGLVNARHRAEKLGGLLRLVPGAGRGTALTWLVPTGA